MAGAHRSPKGGALLAGHSIDRQSRDDLTGRRQDYRSPAPEFRKTPLNRDPFGISEQAATSHFYSFSKPQLSYTHQKRPRQTMNNRNAAPTGLFPPIFAF